MSIYRQRVLRTRLSVSVPADLAAFARETAKREGVTISEVVEVAVRQHRAALVSAEMNAGLIAEGSVRVTGTVVPDFCMSPSSHDEWLSDHRACGCDGIPVLTLR